ncbi:MAG: zinc ABC transporter substrate-binding protein [Methanomicrobiales archaeon HGW-Methanomicrobiales-3]|jgi:zinc transport system substrate-binding protein|nr:MAG: zinc ABC transporter substrate-binding protein [Methanomicrobiales archaeon HGW-Methanomicrobiales-3]
MQKDQDREKAGGRIQAIGSLCAIAGIMVLLIAAGCMDRESRAVAPDNETALLTVAVTILPQKQFVERIAGEHVHVIVLVPPGASPHTHEPTAKQLEDISRASVYIKVGSGIDFERAWIHKLSGVNPRMTIVDSSEGIQRIAGGHDHEETATPADHSDNSDEGEGTDPHIWLSPKNARIMVENTCRGLTRADPIHADEYRANADAYQKELDALDTEISEDIASREVHTFMVYHPAWSYFAKDYGLVQIPIETDGKEPSPAGIENLILKAKNENITVIFASPESSTKSATVIAEEIGGTLVLVSGLEEDYLGNLKKVAQAFTKGGE